MKILFLSDVEDKALWDYYSPERLEGIDLIISCGDLHAEYLEFLVTMSNKPLLYVHGNHDRHYETHPPEGCECIDDRIITFQGLRIMGLGGSIRYNNESKYMYTEDEMRWRLWKMTFALRKSGGVDLLVTHAPARGYGDMDDRPHRGFMVFNKILEKQNVKYMAYGHVHKDYGLFQRTYDHPSGALLLNAWKSCVLDTETGEIRER